MALLDQTTRQDGPGRLSTSPAARLALQVLPDSEVSTGFTVDGETGYLTVTDGPVRVDLLLEGPEQAQRLAGALTDLADTLDMTARVHAAERDEPGAQILGLVRP